MSNLNKKNVEGANLLLKPVGLFERSNYKPSEASVVSLDEYKADDRREEDGSELESVIVPIGRVAGNKLAVYSGYSKEMVLFSASDLNKNNLDMTFGRQNLMSFFPLEQRNGGIKADYEAAADYIIDACTALSFFDPTKVRGAGLWEEGGKYVFNGKACYAISNNGSIGTKNRLGSKFVYGAGSAYNLSDNEATEEDIEDIKNTINSFTFKRKGDAVLAAGWLIQAVVGGALKWRSHLYLNAEYGSGKTTFTKFFERILGFSVRASGESVSAAGIRQKVAASCAPVILDEMEGGQGNMQAMLNLARTASAGDVSIKGSQSQTAVEYVLKSPFLFASIAAPALNTADASRFVQLDLVKNKTNVFESSLLDTAESNQEEVGERFVAFVLKRAHKIVKTIEGLKKELVAQGFEPRAADTLSALLGPYKAIFDATIDNKELIKQVNVKKYVQVEAGKGGDTEIVLNKILHATVRFNMEDVTLAEVVQKAAEGGNGNLAKQLIQRHGLNIQVVDNKPHLVIAKKSESLNALFKGTQYGNGAYANTLLKSCEDAEAKKVKFNVLGKSPLHCVRIPCEAVFGDGKELEDDEEQQPAFPG